MKNSIFDKVIQALKQAEQHNSNIMVKPEVILWPDPERQWTEVIPVLQAEFPQLLVYGAYDPSKMQGPAIWIKCMVAKTLPEANWEDEATPIIYLPGVAKNDLRNVEKAGLEFQPLLEYQYTGTMFTQENGKEWTILAFVENSISGLGLKISKDTATKDSLKKALPNILQDGEVLYGKTIIDADYLNNQLFPDIIPAILKWMCKGDAFLQNMDSGKRETFANLCQSQYDFTPDYRNIKEDDIDPDGLFEQSYNVDDESQTNPPQRYHRSQWERVFTVPVDVKISPVIINKAISTLFLLEQHLRPKYILLLAGNVVFLLEQEKWFRGSYLQIDLEELFSEATCQPECQLLRCFMMCRMY